MSASAPPSFLDSLDAEARALLLSVARQVSFVRGAQLVRHGEAARGAWILREGSAAAVVMLPGGEALTVAHLGAGSMFGEMALLDQGTCTATVSATSNVDGWFVERADFRALVAQRHPAALRIQHAITLILSDKLRQLNSKVLACPSAEDRPARDMGATNDPLDGVARSSRTTFNWRAFLYRLPLFEGFEAGEIDDVADTGRLVERARAAPVFLAGQPAGALFLVVRGAVEVVARHGSFERRLAVLGPGQLFGFMSMLEGLPHGVACYARESALLLEITRPRFEALYLGGDSVAAKLHRAVHRSLLGSLAQTNRRLTRLISELRLSAALDQHVELSAVYHGQLVAAE